MGRWLNRLWSFWRLRVRRPTSTNKGFLLLKQCRQGNINKVKILLKANADVNVHDVDGWTPLYRACEEDHTEIVKLLLEANADVNVQNERGWTPLHFACINKDHTEIVKILLEANADVNVLNKDGWIPLYWACDRGDTEIVKILLEANADVNVRNKNGWTPLHGACYKGHTEIVKLLLEANADVNGQEKTGKTPLEMAFDKRKFDIVHCLLTHGVDVTALNEETRKKLLGYVPQSINEQGLKNTTGLVDELYNATEDEGSTTEKQVKIVLLGQVRAGKTSLLNTLKNEKSDLTKDGPAGRTIGAEVKQIRLGSNVNACFYDFGGHETYHYTHQMFMTKSSIFLIIVDLLNYNHWNYDKEVGFWVQTISSRVPKALIKLVGTHVDNGMTLEMTEKKRQILEALAQQEETNKAAIGEHLQLLKKIRDDEVDLRKAQKADSAGVYQDMSDLQKELYGVCQGMSKSDVDEKIEHIEYLLDNRPIIPEELVPVSSKEMSGIKLLKKILKETIATSTGYFPSISQPLQNVQERIITERRNLNHVLSLKDFQSILANDFKNTKDYEVLNVLQMLGTVIYFNDPNSNHLHEYIFHDPNWILSILGHIFNHDFHNPNMLQDRHFSLVTLQKQSDWKKLVEEQGVMNLDLIKKLVKHKLDKPLLMAVLSLLEKFDIAYRFKVEEGCTLPEDEYFRFPSLLPAEMSRTIYDSWDNICPPTEKEYRLQVKLISSSLPCGLFEKLSVRLNSLLHHRLDWRYGFVGNFRNGKDYIICECSDKHQNVTLNISLRVHRDGLHESRAWDDFIPLLMFVNECLRHYPCVLAERYMVCAHCLEQQMEDPQLLDVNHCMLSKRPPETMKCKNSKTRMKLIPIEEACPVRKVQRETKHEDVRKRLEDNRSALVKWIGVTGLFTELRSAGVMTETDEEKFKVISTTFEQKERLLDHMKCRPDSDLTKFCEALKATNQIHIVKEYIDPGFE